MGSETLAHVGAAIIFCWGVAHVAVLRPVRAGFGVLPDDSRRIPTMEWIAEGLALRFVGLLASPVTGVGSLATRS